MLETGIGAPVPPELLEAWKTRIGQGRAALGWPAGPLVLRTHATGASLAFAAPPDLLYTATELNEWAWLSALADAGRDTGEPALQPGHAPRVTRHRAALSERRSRTRKDSPAPRCAPSPTRMACPSARRRKALDRHRHRQPHLGQRGPAAARRGAVG